MKVFWFFFFKKEQRFFLKKEAKTFLYFIETVVVPDFIPASARLS
jgi:hypothetical protein